MKRGAKRGPGFERYRVPAGKRVRLADVDPADHRGSKNDAEVAKAQSRNLAELAELQELLYAARSRSVLVVLQGIDTSGKDGTIRHVFSGVNPQGCRVATFGVPSALEAAHDYLWRIHRETPARGELVIFNRSHYESVLVERVHALVPSAVWKARYAEINQFERVLTNAGTIVLKFFLHLSRKEQKKRLEARERDPDKRWKAHAQDWEERKKWAAYQEAFEEMIFRTSTADAPWYVVPSDHKWFRNRVIGDRIVSRLRSHRKAWKAAIRRRTE